MSVHAVRYRRERWVTPDGQTIVAPLPEGTAGPLRPRPAPLRADAVPSGPDRHCPGWRRCCSSVGVSISKREIQRLLIEKQDGFLDEAPRRAARRIGDIALDIGG